MPAQGILRKADVKQSNERLILNLIRQSADVSRSDIVRITGLSPSSVTFIVKRLIGDGLISVDRAGSGRSMLFGLRLDF